MQSSKCSIRTINHFIHIVQILLRSQIPQSSVSFSDGGDVFFSFLASVLVLFVSSLFFERCPNSGLNVVPASPLLEPSCQRSKTDADRLEMKKGGVVISIWTAVAALKAYVWRGLFYFQMCVGVEPWSVIQSCT